MKKKLVLNNERAEVGKLAGFIEDIAGELNIPDVLAMSLNLALEETVANVIFYAYPNGGNHTINVTAEEINGKLIFQIDDDGIAYDPTAHKKADTTSSVEDRQVGGLGIFLVRQVMDEMKYQRKDGRNILTLIKSVNK